MFDLYSENEKIGSIDDLLVDDSGHIRYLVISMSIGMGGKKLLLPVGCSRVDYGAQCVYALDLATAQLEALPKLIEGMTVDFDYEDRSRQVYRSASPLNMFVGSGVGYAGYGKEPSVPSMIPSSYGVGYGGEEQSPPAALSPEADPGAEAGCDQAYPYHQDPDLYEVTEQNHQWLKRFEEQLVRRRV